MQSISLKKLFQLLYAHYGKQSWWPAKTPFEVCVGAILTQNTNWGNVEKAIKSLRSARMLSLLKIAEADEKKLGELIRSSGYFNQKAKSLKLFSRHVQENYSGSLEKMFGKPIEELRAELLSLHGIGKETADSIILYAAKKPVFVVDAYTKRIINRIYGESLDSYDELQELFHAGLPHSVQQFNEFHAVLVEHAKVYCRKEPNCKNCPVQEQCSFGLKTVQKA